MINTDIKYNRKNKKIEKVLFMILITGIFFLRIIHLDKDLPPFGIAFYQPMDEGLYSKMTINAYNWGSLHSVLGLDVFTQKSYRSIAISSFIQYGMMCILGDNYYGFRLAYLIFAFLTLIFLIKVIILICNKNNVNEKLKWVFVIGTSFFLSADFPYLISSRVVENSSARMLCAILIVYCFLKFEKQENLKYIVVSFISVISIFFVYFSNSYLLVPIGIIGVRYILRRKWAKVLMLLKSAFVGGAGGFFLAEIYYRTVWSSSAISNLFSGIDDYSARINTVGNDGIEKYFENIRDILGSNIFFFNYIVFILIIIAIIANTAESIYLNNESLFFIQALLLGYILQNIMASDYIERKNIVVYPVIIVNIVYLCINWRRYIAVMKNININIKRLGIISLAVFSISGLYSGYSLRISKYYFYDFSMFEKNLLLIVGGIQIFTAIIVMLLILTQINNDKYVRICSKYLITSMIICIFTNCFFSIKYVYFYNNYSEKEAMIEIGKIADNQIVLGSYSYSYSLYNDIIPVVQTYEKTREYIKKPNVEYYLDYTNNNNVYYINKNIFKDKEKVYIAYEFERKFQTFGQNWNVGLYKKLQ